MEVLVRNRTKLGIFTLAAVTALGVTTGVSAQTFLEAFEGVTPVAGGGVMPAGWVTFDNDGNTPYYTECSTWETSSTRGPGGSGNAVMSNSYYNPAGQADDWMITPAITWAAWMPAAV